MPGNIGVIMEATNNMWEVNISFYVEASDDDEALSRVRDFLPRNQLGVAWAWTSSNIMEMGKISDK